MGLFKKRSEDDGAETVQAEREQPTGEEQFKQGESPWADAQRRYDDRMIRLAAHARNWQRACLVSFGVSFAALAVAAYAVHLPKLMPVPIEVDHLGRSILVDSREPSAQLRGLQEERETIDFITNCRTVIADKMGQRHMEAACYSRLPDNSPARKWIIDHETGPNDPVTVGQDHSVEVTVTNPLKIAEAVWEVEWQEQSIARDGSLLGPPVRYKAHMTDKFIHQDDAKLLKSNPNGYYVQTLSWAQVM